jgi:hypothetical protein
LSGLAKVPFTAVTLGAMQENPVKTLEIALNTLYIKNGVHEYEITENNIFFASC